ncbi:uncharacterized protein inaF-A [Calliphora vicina]|uniref:uncharacterized protein inaF-A n=1 Tax=Calliphora vicina TaxID=7373 RepID=UPI00325B744C
MLSSNSAANSEGEKVPPNENQHSDFFDSQLFRYISVFLYLGGISGLGMALSFYYLIFFDSSMPEIHFKFPISVNGIPVQKIQAIIN